MLKGAELREWRNLMLRNSDSENVLKSKIHTKCLNTLLIFPYENESIIRQKFRKNSTGRQQSGFVAADQVPVCCSSDVDWVPLNSTNVRI